MFTGLVQEMGKVINITKTGDSLKIKIAADIVLKNAQIGDSIATNGVCLTAVELGDGYFTADAMPETFSKTNLKRLKNGDNVNLEKSITLATPLGGHLVTGDVDCEGKIVSIEKDGIANIFTVEPEERLMKYIVEKGRVTLDGASLTVVSYDEKTFKVSLIPHTQENITLGFKKSGDIINVEMDLIGKYVERLLSSYLTTPTIKAKSEIKMDFLMEHGFA